MTEPSPVETAPPLTTASPPSSTSAPASSSSTTPSPAASSRAASDAPIDLTVLLSCLTREDLELLVVQAIARVPSLYPGLLALVTRPVDTSTLTSSLSSLLAFSTLPSTLTPDLEPHVEQASDYVKVGLVKGGLSVLDVLSAQFVEWVKQYRRGKEEEMDDEYSNLESFFGLLESAWSDAFAAVMISDAVNSEEPKAEPPVKGANSLTVKELTVYVNRLQQWQQALTKSMGPVFSDPLRFVKRKIRVAGEAATAGEAEEVGKQSTKRVKR